MALNLLLKATRSLSPKADFSKPRIICIGFSHYSEKGRWALDLSPWATEYYEELHCPAMHLSSTLELMKVPRVSSWETDTKFQNLLNLRHEAKVVGRKEKTGVPKLVIPVSFVEKFNCIHPVNKLLGFDSATSVVVSGGSSGTMKLLSDVFPSELGHLYPASHFDQVVELEHQLDSEFGPQITNWGFNNILLSGQAFDASASVDANGDMIDYFINFNANQPIPFIEKLLFKMLGRRFIIPLMIKANSVTSSNTPAAVAQIHKTFAQMDALLAQNNPTGDVTTRFLLGTPQLTAVDITFAALSAAVLFPPQTARLFPSLGTLRCWSTGKTNNSNSNSSDNNVHNAPGAARLVSLAEELIGSYRSAQYVLDLYAKQRFHVNPPPYYLVQEHENEMVSKSGAGAGMKQPVVRIVEPKVR